MPRTELLAQRLLRENDRHQPRSLARDISSSEDERNPVFTDVMQSSRHIRDVTRWQIARRAVLRSCSGATGRTAPLPRC
jgi:hypothetical protein